MGPTWPNRMYWMTGTIDADGLNHGPIITNKAPAGGYTWTTYAERLERAGVPWKVYQEPAGRRYNMLAQFKAFQEANQVRVRCHPRQAAGGLPIGRGFRVPCIIVSPWTMGGWVSSQPFDHTSVLQFLEKFTSVREPNISEWRRRTFGDLTSALRFVEPGKKAPVLPDTLGTLNLAKYASENLPKPTLPGAEPLRKEHGLS